MKFYAHSENTKGEKIMSNGKTIIDLNKHVQENFWLYVVSIFCIFTGIVIGIYTVKYMGAYDKTELLGYFSNFGENVREGNFKYNTIFMDVLKNNGILIIAIWFLGLTMIGIPAILILDIVKGFTIGFSISFIINGLGTQGIAVVLLGIMPQNIIYIPCLLVFSVIAMEFSLGLIRDKFNKQRINSIWIKITSYSVVFILVSVFMAIGFIFETYLTPNLVKLII
jgi:stage II sporulation protein M